jgi:1,4-alpha-glucan branching enzyme
MAMQTVEFRFITGLKRAIFRNARLRGSWDGHGRYSDDWTESPMQAQVGDDGCPIFTASISLDLADQDRTFQWGVVLDGPQGSNFWGIPTEVQDVNSAARHRQFRLAGGGGHTPTRTLLLHVRPSLGSQPTLRGRTRHTRPPFCPVGASRGQRGRRLRQPGQRLHCR